MARNHYDFTNQRAIVTGGAQGIGRAIVDRLVAGSAKVAIWDMDASLAETVASEYPEGQVVHAGQGHIRRPNHERNHPVRQTHKGRHDGPEDHDQTVVRGHLVKEGRLHELQARLEELGANDQRHEPAHKEHNEAEPKVHRADVLVVRGVEPASNALRRTVIMIVVMGFDNRAHIRVSWSKV